MEGRLVFKLHEVTDLTAHVTAIFHGTLENVEVVIGPAAARATRPASPYRARRYLLDVCKIGGRRSASEHHPDHVRR